MLPVPVTCKSLNTLIAENFIAQEVGILKTDTEGNDLKVLKGASNMKAEIIICEYFAPGLYAGWEQGNPIELIAEAKKLGFQHYIATKRIDNFELVGLDPLSFSEKQWGNLIFICDDIFEKALLSIHKIIAERESLLFRKISTQQKNYENEIKMLLQTCEDRLKIINKLSESFKIRLKNKLLQYCRGNRQSP